MNIGNNPLIQKLFLSRLAETNIVIYLVSFWINPNLWLNINPNAINAIEMFVVFEFLFGHANAGISISYLMDEKRSRGIFKGAIAFYGIFFIVFIASGYFFEVILYMYTIFSRIYRVSQQDDKTNIIIKQVFVSFFRIVILILSIIPAMLPWPTLGLSEVTFTGSGALYDFPGRVLAWPIIYFLLIPYTDKLTEKVIFKSNNFKKLLNMIKKDL